MEIRPVTIRDAEAIAEIRRQDGVREGVLGLSSERVAVTEDFLRSFGERDRGFVAVENGETVGFAVMLANREECRAHSGFIACSCSSPACLRIQWAHPGRSLASNHADIER